MATGPFSKTKVVITSFYCLCGFVSLFTFLFLIRTSLKINPKHEFIKFETNLVGSKNDNKTFSRKLLTEGDAMEVNKTMKHMKTNFRTSLLPETFLDITKDCQGYFRMRKYINMTMSEGERQFPIAFSLLVYKHVEQVERLLRAIWRPQNVYCIHVDKKSNHYFTRAIRNISQCFDNVFLPSKMVNVVWGSFTVLEPELICMEALLKHKRKWKYFINLTGQEFPLKTNYELYRILESYKGANDIQGYYKRANLHRWQGRGTIPHGIKPRKGSVHIAATCKFVDYITHNQTALDFLKWVQKTRIPDETFFASLNHNPHLKIPGSYKGDADDGLHDPMTRYKIWYDKKKCAGKISNSICIFSVGDLKKLTSTPELFANKFLYEYHYLAYDCLENWYYAKVEKEMRGHLDFNTTIYKQRRIVTHHF